MPARVTLMSSSPPLISWTISFLRDSGWMNSGLRLYVFQQPVGVLREAEEVVLLLDPLGLRAVRRAHTVLKVLLLKKGLAGLAVVALVVTLVDVVLDGLEEPRQTDDVIVAPSSG